MASNFIIQKGPGIASKVYNYAKNIFKPAKVSKTIKTTKPGTELKFKRQQQDDFIRFRDKLHQGFSTETKNELKAKNPLSKINKRISDIKTPGEPKFNKGGRVGLKLGTKKKSNVQKIKKTFGPKGLGMQSVIYGLDKNPKITAADPKAKFIAAAKKKTKKKVI